jgi:TRAP-type uncharacterized transport system substrate-binding protein
MQSRRRMIFWTVFVVVLAAAIWTVLRFVSPLPPRALVMSTGVADGAYHYFGQRYREILKANGIRLELRNSSGGIENLARLYDGSVSVAFVQGGTGPWRSMPMPWPSRRRRVQGNRRLRTGPIFTTR